MSSGAVVDETARSELRERRQKSRIRALNGAEFAQKTPQLFELGSALERQSGSAIVRPQVARGHARPGVPAV
eukprot:11834226-Alexandrium_andersonii.AAC.1